MSRKRGPDCVQIGAEFRAQIYVVIKVLIAPAVALRSGASDVVLYAHELMVVLRCTQKLLVRLKHVGELPPGESTSRLGDWYGNILWIGRRQHLLFISERSRLPVVLPIREVKRLGMVFPDTVCARLALVGVAAGDIADERMRMSELTFGRTRNRSLLGTLNDFAFMAQSGDARRTEPESPEELMRFLSQTPILPLDGASPIELTRAAFGR
ncbi:MAG: hypothetical protein PVSMB1_10410 [Gemmatimonadaceae bacterium]